ncbi:cell division protein FtsA [Alkaliphilus hydrothermalis]|uniref:Chaperone protein DnaK n=1 Tax=Alkaliphilus hydrothermalis TaxID=1482730 RepID=A0ABS2NNI6_9FIRM|nr:pilus assembly protein PilM [Alkaliphilus hydrothermalis]MBM7614421.1 cell division protein FtsA [Alkaliphilus hydrothermalis]
MDNNSYDKGSIVFALDIGTRSVIGILGSYRDKKIVIHHSAIEFHQNRAMFDGQIHDIEEVASIVGKVKSQLEVKAGFTLKEVAIAAAGRALKTQRIEIEKELDENKSIDRHLVNSIEIEGLQMAKLQLEERDAETTNYFCVGHTVINYFLNNGIITNPVGHRGRSLKMDILATFLPHVVVDSLYTVMNKVGLEVTYMTLEPIAAIEVAVPQSIRLLNIAMVDIGAGTSDIAITKDGAVVAYGMTSTAGDELTEAIAKNYLLDFDTAEAVKCQLCQKEYQHFTDILGMQHEIPTETVLEAIQPAIKTIAKDIASNILLQNEKAPSAIFLIGGGSQIPFLNEEVANLLEMPKERVVVRGTEIIQNLNQENLLVVGPEGITPVGILVKALENQSRDFIEINVNGKEIKLFQSKKLKVSDALVLIGFNPRDLIPKRGKTITVMVNGKEKSFYGEYGVAAEIYVNRLTSSLDSPIKGGDTINILPAKQGKDALCSLKDVVDLNTLVEMNGNHVKLVHQLTLNGEAMTENVPLKDGDIISYKMFKTVEELCHQLNIKYNDKVIYINGKVANLFDFIKDHDKIELIDMLEVEESENIVEEEIIEEENVQREMVWQKNEVLEEIESSEEAISLIYNGRPLTIPKTKTEMIFVDIFDYVDFDRYQLKGKLILLHNGENANYVQPLMDGDEIVVKWDTPDRQH